MTNPSEREAVARAMNEADVVNASPRGALLLAERLCQQVETDLAAAHGEICKLQGLDPAAHSWPKWSSPANTLRWVADTVRPAIRAADAAIAAIRSGRQPGQVTEAMIRAGDAVLKRQKFAWWETMNPGEGHDLIRDIISAAMHEATDQATPMDTKIDETAMHSPVASPTGEAGSSNLPTHFSDCAVHNAPASEPGPCDCGAAIAELEAEVERLKGGLRHWRQKYIDETIARAALKGSNNHGE